ncbi:KIN17-like protein [Penicillium angulare]|uniref:KIN17-like protein n=1 Tax=Penicillium angulare TaxID=116970 RepID=UPI00253F78B4|nr:KIN17-like protein [Penicillium angulare]KAJ5261305.1 KIN17-like protein [Penicillium angulare]
MPKAEAGSVKAIGNRMKMKGLGRLRWYCQICEKQTREANSFKQHLLSEAHVRRMAIVGEDPKKYIKQYTDEFVKTFVDGLRTRHGEKAININHFYQEIVADKEHIHMNATEFSSLNQFAQYLGKNGICRVEETEKGIFVSWVDNSPETMRKREAVQKKEREEKNDEQREQKMILEQVERARKAALEREGKQDEDADAKLLQREEGEKMKLNLGLGPKKDSKKDGESASADAKDVEASGADVSASTSTSAPAPAKISMSFGGAQKPKNVFSAAKKNPLAGKKGPMLVQPKKMTEQERIMKAEMEAQERKRSHPGSGANPKRPRFS